VGSGADHTTTW